MLTMRQAEAHRFIFEYTRHNGVSPSHVEIREALGVTGVSSVVWLLGVLEERGLIKLVPYGRRSITVLRKPPLPHTQYFKVVDQILVEMT